MRAWVCKCVWVNVCALAYDRVCMRACMLAFVRVCVWMCVVVCM